MSTIDTIRAAMAAQGRKQRDVVELLGLSKSTVSQTFSGQRRLTLADAETLKEWLGIEPVVKVVGFKDAQIAEIFDLVLDLSVKMNSIVEAVAMVSARVASLEVKVATMSARLDRATVRAMGHLG